MNLRLLVVSGGFPPVEAPESAHTLHICEQLAAKGVDVHLLTNESAMIPQGLQEFHVYPGMKAWGWKQLLTIMFTVRRVRPAAVLLIYIDWIYKCHPMMTFVPAALRWLQPGLRIVTQFENESGLSSIIPPKEIKTGLIKTIFGLLTGWRGLHPLYGSLLRDSSSIIALSERHLEAFERAHPGISAKAMVIPAPPLLRIKKETIPGSNRESGRVLLGLSGKKLILVYFGYLYSMKGIETLLKAFGLLPVDTHLIIIGSAGDPTYLKSLHEESRQAGGADRVQWLGHLEDERTSVTLRAADICVLPFNDGVRLNNSSFAVAATLGLPIVTTRGEILEHPFVDRENVMLCPPKDPVALAGAINELARSPEIRHRISAGARKLAEKHFSWDRVIGSTLDVLCSPAAVK